MAVDDPKPLPRSCIETRNPSPAIQREGRASANRAPSKVSQQKHEQEKLRLSDRSKGSIYRWGDERLQNTKVCTAKLDKAAVVLQRFFNQRRRHARLLHKQQGVLMERIKEIETVRQKELEAIARSIEERRSEALREIQEDEQGGVDQEQQADPEALEVARSLVAELKQEMKNYKKENAFLQKRCSELQKDNTKLWTNMKKQVHRQTRLGDDCKKLPKMINERMLLLARHQRRVNEYQSRLEVAEKQWNAMKLTNKRIRDHMRSIVQMVEEREPGGDDKWDLVDELYQLQRGTSWKRKCNASVKCGRGCSGSLSAPPQLQPSKPPHSAASRRPSSSSHPMQIQTLMKAYFPQNRPRTLRSERKGSKFQ